MKGWDHVPDWAHSMAQALLQTLKLRDPYTYGHCRRVARHSKLLAQAAGLPESDQRSVEFASWFHDLGKLAIPDRILLHPGKLDDEQMAVIREHPIKSVEVLQPLTTVPFFKGTIPGVLYHHERIDGCGYPYGLAGDRIPLTARIILVADTFDAMTTTRPYRKGLSAETAYKELQLFAGRQFDEQLVKIFVQAHPTWGDVEQEISEEFVAASFKRAA